MGHGVDAFSADQELGNRMNTKWKESWNEFIDEVRAKFSAVLTPKLLGRCLADTRSAGVAKSTRLTSMSWNQALTSICPKD